MIFGKRAFFGYIVSPAGDVWWFANPPWATELSKAELAVAPEQWRERLVDLFGGDSTSGQGASLAIEDAVVLARCLRDLPNMSSAFAAFEQLRRPRVERVVAWAAHMNRNKMPGPIARAFRDAVLPVILKRLARRSQSWLFDSHIEWEERIDPAARAA